MEEQEVFRPKEFYRERIISVIKEINNTETLIKIYKVVETYLKIQKGEI